MGLELGLGLGVGVRMLGIRFSVGVVVECWGGRARIVKVLGC